MAPGGRLLTGRATRIDPRRLPARPTMTHRPFPAPRFEKTNMPLYFRIILGCLAIGGAGFTIPALWTGIAYGRDWNPPNRDEAPRAVGLLQVAHLRRHALSPSKSAGH